MNLRHSLAAALSSCALAAPALAHDIVFVANLNGSAEFPPNSSPGTGFATITFNDHDFTMHVEVSFSGLAGNVTASHVHCCTTTAGTLTAGVATQTPTFTGFPLGGTSGTYDHLFDMTQATSWNSAFVSAHGNSTGQAFDDLLAGAEAGKAYLNIHTNVVPGGEIRGFLQLAAIPEPQTWALLLAGLGVVGGIAQRRTTG